MPEQLRQLLTEIRQIYQEMDQQIVLFQNATRLHCPAGCGACCESQEVEATVPELLPLAEDIFQTTRQDAVAELIEQKEKNQDLACVLYRPDPLVAGNGRCGCYPLRPLVCRLFGFAGRRNKKDELEFSTCKRIKAQDPEKVRAAQAQIKAGLSMPVFQSSFMRLAALHPGLGFQRLPINQALKKALQYCFWKNQQ